MFVPVLKRVGKTEEDSLRNGKQDASKRQIFEMKSLMHSLPLKKNDDLTHQSLVKKTC